MFFSEDEKRVEVFSQWHQLREGWVDLQKLHDKTRSLFTDLYSLYFDLKRDSETIEIVSANGFIMDKTDQSIFHPLITHKSKIEFNADENTVSICDVDSQSELYSALLQNMSDINTDSLKSLVENLVKNDYHPLDRNELPGFLKILVRQLTADSVFSEDSIPYEWQKTGRLLMLVKPCFIVRKRVNGTLKAIEKIIEDVSETGYVPSPIKDIVSGGIIEIPESTDEESIVKQLAAVGGESLDILLSKEANKEQLEIAKRIENYNAVLVQGPPGTGKTHTIANLMGHFLAQGKSVLVTSYTNKALSVLKEKVPEGLQDLCVSMTDDSNVDMEKSVDGITSYMSKTTSFEVNKQMLRLQEERKEVMKKLADIRQRMFTILNEENSCLSFNGESISPSEVSKFVADNKDSLSYIPGKVSPYTPLPLTLKQLSNLYRSNELITSELEDELSCDIPNPSTILFPEDFSAICVSVEESRNAINKMSEYTGMDITVDETIGKVSFGEMYSVNTYSDETVIALKRYCDSLDSFREWMKYATVDGKNGGSYANRWHQLINQIKKTCELGERNISESFTNKVVYTDEASLLSNKDTIEEIAQIYDTKGKLSKLTITVHKEYERALSSVSINGHAINSFMDCSIVLHAIEYIEQKQLCESFWNDLLGNHGVALFNSLDAHEPERVAFNSIELIETYLSWYANVFSQIQDWFNQIGISYKKMFSISEFDSELVVTEKILKGLKELVPYVCEALLAASNITRKLRFVNESKGVFSTDKRSSSRVCKACHEALSELNVEHYSEAYAELSSVYEKYELLSQRERLLDELEKVAFDWSQAIRNRVGIHGNQIVPETIENAWKWKQFSTIVDEYFSKPFSQLQKDSISLSKEYRRLTAEYAEKSGWFNLLRRTEADIDIKQALQGWKLTVQRIGKGTGKQAPALKAQAKKLMAKCQMAVPGWIMPINKALDSLDPRVNRFDIIIIDEASQADISALAILYMGKKLIVVGDDKQVSPMAIGTEIEKIKALQDIYLKNRIPLWHLYSPETSIYDIAATTFQPLMLREHFRCVPEIIGFSNMLSYDYKIKPLRPASDSSILPAVVNYRVEKGNRSDNKTNYNEARTIVALMKACMKQDAYTGKTFGVITLLGDEQADLLRKLVDESIDSREIMNRRIICGNSAHFQGDERDVIFLSVVDSGTGSGPLAKRGFGPKDSYRKRYNVAASRAKDQLWVVDSLDPASDLQAGDIRKILIDYSLNPNAAEVRKEEIKAKSDSPFETEVASYLSLRGYHLVQQWQVGAYRLDMVAIYGKKAVAIECDGEKWHSGETKIREDMERQTILERLGWRFIRIRGSEYYNDKEKAMDRVISELSTLGIEPEDEHPEEVDRSSELLDRVKAEALRILNGEEKNEPIDNSVIVELALNPNSIPMPQKKAEKAAVGNSNPQVNVGNDVFIVSDFEHSEVLESNKNDGIQDNVIKENKHQEEIGENWKAKKSVSNKTDSNKRIIKAPEQVKKNSNTLLALLKSNNVVFIDKRDKGGALWLVGGQDLKPVVVEARKIGYYFSFAPNGSKTTDWNPGWWTK